MMINDRIGRSAMRSSIAALILGVVLATAAWADGRILNRVHVGGPDACFPSIPGCDANFSLVAIQFDDLTVTGQFTDRWPDGNGFQAVIDCLFVNGNEAWVSGTVTHGIWNGFDFSGSPVIARVRDNGTSANDPADQISWSSFMSDISCIDMPDMRLFDIPQGQVKVN